MGGFDEDAAIDLEISAKMAKSIPETCIFVHDSPEEISDKIKKAFCPAGQVEGNPILEIADYLLFRDREREFTIERLSKFGGDITYWSYEELEKGFREKALHPQDLKNKVAQELDTLITPCRKYFQKHPEYLEVFTEQNITR
jgi:tyrosyl-tRNA synthetase